MPATKLRARVARGHAGSRIRIRARATRNHWRALILLGTTEQVDVSNVLQMNAMRPAIGHVDKCVRGYLPCTSILQTWAWATDAQK